MTSRLAELTARRIVLQESCEAQRQELSRAHGAVAQVVAPVDRAAGVARDVLPLVAVAGIVGLIAVGPHRTLSLLRRGLSIALVVTQVLNLARR